MPWIGPFQFTCPFCNARPGKPCRHTTGPRAGKTTKTHGHRYARFRAAQYGVRPGQRDAVIWTNAVETNRQRH